MKQYLGIVLLRDSVIVLYDFNLVLEVLIGEIVLLRIDEGMFVSVCADDFGLFVSKLERSFDKRIGSVFLDLLVGKWLLIVVFADECGVSTEVEVICLDELL